MCRKKRFANSWDSPTDCHACQSSPRPQGKAPLVALIPKEPMHIVAIDFLMLGHPTSKYTVYDKYVFQVPLWWRDAAWESSVAELRPPATAVLQRNVTRRTWWRQTDERGGAAGYVEGWTVLHLSCHLSTSHRFYMIPELLLIAWPQDKQLLKLICLGWLVFLLVFLVWFCCGHVILFCLSLECLFFLFKLLMTHCINRRYMRGISSH